MGDEILYVPPIFVQGDHTNNCQQKMATVISVNADAESGHKIEISTGDLIPDEYLIKHTKIMKEFSWQYHPLS